MKYTIMEFLGLFFIMQSEAGKARAASARDVVEALSFFALCGDRHTADQQPESQTSTLGNHSPVYPAGSKPPYYYWQHRDPAPTSSLFKQSAYFL